MNHDLKVGDFIRFKRPCFSKIVGGPIYIEYGIIISIGEVLFADRGRYDGIRFVHFTKVGDFHGPLVGRAAICNYEYDYFKDNERKVDFLMKKVLEE